LTIGAAAAIVGCAAVLVVPGAEDRGELGGQGTTRAASSSSS
jgi:hypothetical protein